MIQCRDGSRLVLETLGELRLCETLMATMPIEPCVPRFVHLSHAARADLSENFIWPEFVPVESGMWEIQLSLPDQDTDRGAFGASGSWSAWRHRE